MVVLFSFGPAYAVHADDKSEMSPQYNRLLIKNANLIDGTGAPMSGPVDILIERGKIANIVESGVIQSTGQLVKERADGGKPVDRTIDAAGKCVMPGIIESHMHYHALPKDYIYRLYLAHGVTSIRNVDGSLDAQSRVPEDMLAEKRRIEAGEVLAPRLFVYPYLPVSISSGEQVAPLVKSWHDLGVDGIKVERVNMEYPDVLKALGSETEKYGMGLAAHLSESASPGVNALIAARDGVTTIEHYYGYAETALLDTTIPRLPVDYNFLDERMRFRVTLGIWLQADMKKLEHVTVPELVKLSTDGRFTMVPTMVVYEKQRDLTRASNVPWLQHYALPSLLKMWQIPDKDRHGAIFDRWTSNDEAQAAQVYRRWMAFILEYVYRGGHLAVGSDSGGPFQLYGFQTIREMELLLEAGLTPLEVIRSATQEGARVLMQPKMGVIRPGFAADLLIIDENPLENFKVLMANRPALDSDGKPQRRTLIRYVMVDGRLMDPDRLLADVEDDVGKDRSAHSVLTGAGTN